MAAWVWVAPPTKVCILADGREGWVYAKGGSVANETMFCVVAAGGSDETLRADQIKVL